ncbi:TPA: hypothetical protein PXN54_002143 [Yersinia enterocolitica]|nr:hypothetical protein [Yersinia enterocolitica]
MSTGNNKKSRHRGLRVPHALDVEITKQSEVLGVSYSQWIINAISLNISQQIAAQANPDKTLYGLDFAERFPFLDGTRQKHTSD